MLIHAGYEVVFEILSPAVPMQMLLFTHPDRIKDLRQPERITLEPNVGYEEFIDSFGNRCARVVAPPGPLRIFNDLHVEDSGKPDAVNPNAKQHPVQDLPQDVLPFLLASRYCEVDRLSEIAWNLFGQSPLGWGRVQAVCDWVHQHVEFGYQHARSTRTAYEVYQERKGVCRDFMHLSITLLRCLNIPARYATGYLGDIGVPPCPWPMDFSAWFEVYLDNRWYTFDARHNQPRIGRILMARGRDAVDCALTTSFGPTKLQKFTVWTDEVARGAT